MPDGAINAKRPDDNPLRVHNPEQIPARRYYDADFYELERQRMWTRTWQMACRLDEIPNGGDWVEYKIFDKSVVIVRAESGIKAFHNACRHRGMKIARGRGHCDKTGFTCNFHGWRYDLNGKNVFVYGGHKFSADALKSGELNLRPCRVETWGGCAFINFDDDAAPFIDHIAPMAERVGPRNVDQMNVQDWIAIDLPVNWKLAMEAFMEGYHRAQTHPQLQEASTVPAANRYGEPPLTAPPPRPIANTGEAIDINIEYMQMLGDGMGGMIHSSDVAIARTLRDREWSTNADQARMDFYGVLNSEITKQARARGIAMPDFNELAVKGTIAPVEYIFPNYFLLIQFGNMSSYRIRPTGPESCLFELWALSLYPEGRRETLSEPKPVAYNDPSLPRIPSQDYDNLPFQQEGLHAQGFEYMRLSHEVEGLISNYQRLIDGYIAGADSKRLAAVSAIVSAPLDTPILDIGL